LKGRQGLTLIETIIAMCVLAIIAISVLTAIRSAVVIGINVRERATAKNLAESEMEYVKALPNFSSSYSPINISGYEQFSTTIIVENVPSRDPNDIQKVTIVVKKVGQDKELMRLSNYKLMQ
jgi:Tfp pilus assembly protein PilV